MHKASGFLVLGLLALFPSAGLAGGNKTHFEERHTGTLVAVDATGHFTPVPGATVQLKCIGPAVSKHFNLSCSSSLIVKRSGKELARLESGLLGVDYDVVAGNASAVSLELLPVGGGASLIVVHKMQREGDEEMRETNEDQVLAIDGTTLREVHTFESFHSVDLGPDRDMSTMTNEERRLRVRLRVDGSRTLDVPNLISQEQVGDSTSWRDDSVLTWDGKRYNYCSSCKTKKAQAKAAAAPTPVRTAPASLTDPLSSASIEPLLDQIFRGQRLSADALKPLAESTLSLLRNAPFARHGRPFKSPNLQSFFYAERTPKLKLLPLLPNPAFQDTLLDDSDRANVAAVLSELRRRAGSTPQN